MSLGRWDEQLIDHASDVLIFFIISYRLRALKTLCFYFCKFIKKIKKYIHWNQVCKEFCKKSWKRIILGTSDAWSTSHLSQWTSEPAYYIVDCRISRKPVQQKFQPLTTISKMFSIDLCCDWLIFATFLLHYFCFLDEWKYVNAKILTN